MAVAVNVTIVFDGDPEKYSIVKIPSNSSAIVLKQKKGLLQQVDLKSFVDDLGRVGGFVRVAYNGATAAGPEFGELQVDIQKIGFEVADLCDASAITVAKFEDASGSILEDLQATYEYLLEDETDMALETFKGIAEVAGEMRKAAEVLQAKFEAEIKKVEGAVNDTVLKKSGKAKEVEKIKEERAIAEKEKKEQEKRLDTIKKDVDKYEEWYDTAQKGQDKALEDMVEVGWWGNLTGKRAAYRKKVDEKREQRKEALKLMDEEREHQQKALDAIAEATKTLIACSQDKENVSQAAVEALRQAEAGLRNLSIVMRRAAQFWNHMEEHCKKLSMPRVAREFKALEKKETPEGRMKVFTSNTFKRGAVEFYARWVALNVVCSEYMDHIKHTQEELYSYIRDAPSYAQAKKAIGDLAKRFLADVEIAQEELAKKRQESEDERMALEVAPAQEDLAQERQESEDERKALDSQGRQESEDESKALDSQEDLAQKRQESEDERKALDAHEL